MKIVMLVDDKALRRVRSAIERVAEVSRKDSPRQNNALERRPPLAEAADQLIALLRSSFRIVSRQK
jgi:hypothetical protein